MFTKQLVDDEKSPLMPLISEAELERQIDALRSHLADDSSAAVQADLMRPEVSELVRLPWWQRMAIPGSACFTTSDHARLKISDPGFLNTLGTSSRQKKVSFCGPCRNWRI
jgi:hypothetical protein